ncbi:hypothetical protein [Paraburkholderia antibiotica]|uniref:Uncharacterized protein n=1 Tax=Paraburkholderia antibiotica TaxID=2728839 RepID=A0A7X9ZWN1_9BURK|nr:hypothetical protein [Paraburkholderia antibiotica]NML29740.1 hypothetical protein [Paraburkholderia antibiotica]
MFDVIPYWMWAVSLLVLALVCGAALSASDARQPARPRLPRVIAQRARRPLH